MDKKMEDFFSKKPGIRKKYEFPGTFREFAAGIAKSVTVVEEAARILSKEVSPELLENQLSRHPIISYADHHGLLNYKLLYNSNILYAEIIKEMKLPYVVVFASGSVPLVNTSHGRGFYFKKQKFNFFAERPSKAPVYLFPNKLCAEKEKGIDSILNSYPRDLLTGEEKKFLEFLFFDCLNVKEATEHYERFSDQLTFLNYKVWKYYFDKSIRNSIPDIVYLQTNQILVKLLIDEIKKEDSLISLILFDPKVREVFLKIFYGIQCCWGDDRGSYLFWGIYGKKKRFIRLQFDPSSNSVVGKDTRLELNRENVIEHLMTKKILQTVFFDFLIITFLGGYLVLGGFNQIEYLTHMQKAHIKSLKEIGMSDMADDFASRLTDGFICGMLPFTSDSGIDLIWHYNSTGGKFNGNLDRGLTQDDLDKMLNMKLKTLIYSAVETMLDIVG